MKFKLLYNFGTHSRPGFSRGPPANAKETKILKYQCLAHNLPPITGRYLKLLEKIGKMENRGHTATPQFYTGPQTTGKSVQNQNVTYGTD